jgi:predicted dehydrogenase
MRHPKLAVIGAGSIAQFHFKAFENLGGNVVAAADIKDEALDNAREKFGVTQLYRDYRKMLREVRPDGVLVSTPNYLHSKMACDAMKAGANVLLEKPMTTTLAQAEQILKVEKQTRKWTMMAFCCRFKPETLLAKKMHDAGKFGDVYHSDIGYVRRRGIPKIGSWFTKKKESGGGVLIDLGCHILDQSLYIMGAPEPVEVLAGVHTKFGADPDKYVYLSMWGGPPEENASCDVDDFAAGLIRFKNGSTMHFTFSWAANTRHEGQYISLYGDKGGARLGMGAPSGFEIYGEDTEHLVDETPYLPQDDIYEAEDREFVKCLEKGRKPVANARQGFYIQSIIDAIYRSGRQKRPVKVVKSGSA